MSNDPDEIRAEIERTRMDFSDDVNAVADTLDAIHNATALIAGPAWGRVDNLSRALTSSRRIGMAMGVLMAAPKLTQDEAFTLLRIASQNSNRKLVGIADDVITTGTLEPPHRRRRPRHTQPHHVAAPHLGRSCTWKVRLPTGGGNRTRS